MLKYLLFSMATASFLAGCASNDTYQTEPQYCYTDEVIENTNGSVSSKTVTTCSDKPKVHHLTRDIGVAGMCRSYNKPVTRSNGQSFVIKGVLCRDKITGAWVPADPNLSY
jgi:hypothetical protein